MASNPATRRDLPFAGPPSDASPAAVRPGRIRHVDSLRAVAAGLVIWTHFAASLRPVSMPGPAFLEFLYTLPPTLNLGRTGVMIFFAVSGFVICRSLDGPRAGAGRRFLIKRFCRLYPAFWVSLIGVAWVWHSGAAVWTWRALAANATMVPDLFGQSLLLGLYWTLEVELIFYALCLGLHRVGGLQRRAVLAGWVVALAGLPRALRGTGRWLGVPLGLPGDGDTWTVGLAVMFWGALFRLVYDETDGFRRGVFTRPGPWWLTLLAAAMIDLHDPGLKRLLLHPESGLFLFHLGTVDALVVFILWVACLRVDAPWLTFLGVASYSLYLFHPLVLRVLLRLGAFGTHAFPLWVNLLAGAAFTAGLAAAVYRWVERPAILLGQRWAGTGRDAARHLASAGREG